MRKIYSDRDAYKIFVEEFGKTVARAKKINPNAKVEMITPYSSFVGALQDKINDAKARGTRPSSKAKLAKTLAHYYAYPTTAEDVSKLKDNVGELMSGGFDNYVNYVYKSAGYEGEITSIDNVTFAKLEEAYKALNKKGSVNDLRAFEHKDLINTLGLDKTIAIVKDVLAEQGITGKDANKWIATHIFKSPD